MEVFSSGCFYGEQCNAAYMETILFLFFFGFFLAYSEEEQ